MAQNAETSTDRDGNEMTVETPDVAMPTIRGMQGNTWSETIRTDDQYYEMAFPRVAAVAERAWHRGSWELDWTPGVTYNLSSGRVPIDELAEDYNGFASALGCRELAKLGKLGISYRVPPPGASIDSLGVLTANSELPCTIIMYSTDEGNTWSQYSSPVGVGAGSVVHLQSVSSDGVLKSRLVVADEECVDCGKEVDASDVQVDTPDVTNELSSSDDVEQIVSDPDNYYCGFHREDAAQNCLPCPAGRVSECGNPLHGCFKLVGGCTSVTSDGQGGSSTKYASELATNLRVLISMGKNFDHAADCSMAEWGICHTQTLIIDYLGDEDYFNK